MNFFQILLTFFFQLMKTTYTNKQRRYEEREREREKKMNIVERKNETKQHSYLGFLVNANYNPSRICTRTPTQKMIF